MKVLQINSIYKKGSTGRTTFEVEKALLEHGDEALVAYGYGDAPTSENAIRINNSFSNNIHKVLSRVTGLEAYFSFWGTYKLIRFIKKNNPDIIHIRCLHGDYLNLPILMSYLKNFQGPVFVNLHDCWDFTGHCPHFGSCEKWKTGCHDCERFHAYPKSLWFDTSRKCYNDKKKWYSSIKHLYVVAVSKWLKNLAEESILKNGKIDYIYNWIDQDLFNPKNRRPESNSVFSVVFVSASWEPGTYRYEMLQKLVPLLDSSIHIKVVGIYSGDKIEAHNVEYVGYVSDTAQLADIYANSSVYIHLSVEEAFGKVIAEANASGIPAIVFNVSGCAEVVSEKSGYRVPVGNIDAIVSAVNEIRKNGYDYYASYAVENVNQNFNYRTNVHRLIGLYESALKEIKAGER